jgi:hypothetical protein
MSSHQPPSNLGDTSSKNPADTTSAASESPIDLPIPGVPSDNATLTEIVNSLESDGYVHQFTPAAGSTVECSGCLQQIDAASLAVASIRRLEGASDPDDMMSVIAARCPSCGALGTLILGYGVNASVDDGEISRALDVRDSARQAGSPPLSGA